MSRTKLAFSMAFVVFASVGLSGNQAKAQYGYSYNNGSNFGVQQNTNWNVQQGIHTQRPGAAIVGSILGGIGSGLNASNPQKHAVASNVLGGIGQGFMIASQPTIWSQGSVNHQTQGYQNNWGKAQFRPAPQPYRPGPSFRPTVRPMPSPGVRIGRRPW